MMQKNHIIAPKKILRTLINNFEIVTTSLIALIVFKEKIGKYLWIGISFITTASIILSFDFGSSFSFFLGSILVLLATLCWGVENNFTKKISNKSSYQIVIIKGLGSGLSSLIIALIIGEKIPEFMYIAYALLLGFIAYGLSIFVYVRAQKILGAAKTSAFYAVAPFVGSLLSFLIIGEKIEYTYLIALGVMIIGTVFLIIDTMTRRHDHGHYHIMVHTHYGTTHEHKVYHEHRHKHLVNEENHNHHHSNEERNNMY